LTNSSDLLQLTKKAMQAVQEGYNWAILDHWDDGYYIRVDNPLFEEDNGSDPYLILHISRTE